MFFIQMKVRKKGRFLIWLKDNKKRIFIVVALVAFIIVLNYIIRGTIKPVEKKLITSYDPSTPIISSEYTIPEDEKDEVEDTINKYIEYCNNKEYQNAYNLLSSGCKKKVFDDDISKFSLYVLKNFGVYKIYDIQNLSNDKEHYIYRLRTMYDYLSKGLNSFSELMWQEEEIILTKENNEFKISIQSFIESNELNKKYSDDNIYINIDSVDKYYDKEIYTVTMKNFTNNYIVLNSLFDGNEVLIQLDSSETREMTTDITELTNFNSNMYLKPYGEETFVIQFNKYFDEYIKKESIIFNKVKILKDYSSLEEDFKEENIVKAYSIEMEV